MNSDITISLIRFSDGSNQVSTACIYPVSYNQCTHKFGLWPSQRNTRIISMYNQHHQVCRRIQGMQHSLKWMQCRHSWSIPDHCPEITTVPIQVKNEEILSKYRGSSSKNIVFQLFREMLSIQQIFMGISTSTRIMYQGGWSLHEQSYSCHGYSGIRILTSGKC